MKVLAGNSGKVFFIYGFLLFLTPIFLSVYLESNETAMDAISESTESGAIQFDRNLDCDRCGQHKVPSEANVKITITASFDGTLNGIYFADYFPINWPVIDGNGGTFESYNSSHNRISWHYDSITGSVSQWYVAQATQVTHPTTKYDFISELNNVQSDPWMVVVADKKDYVATISMSNVNNATRGTTDDVTCTITTVSTGTGSGPVDTNISLQYNNGTTGGWINLNWSYANTRNITYNNFYGPNPNRSTAATLVYNFRIFGNWTSTGNLIRCNATNSTPSATLVSSTGTLNVTQVNLDVAKATGGFAEPMLLASDGSNDFNLTCNVSADVGNATSVSVYAQWNVSATGWGNITTSTNGALYADVSSPQVLSDVGNVNDLVSFLVKSNGTVGSYQVRCYANSSPQNGATSNNSNTSLVTVSVFSLNNVAIGNVSNIYRGDTDSDIFCNATSTGGSVAANIMLQYNNGTVGDWINLNESNKANNVSYVNTYGANPRAATVTTTGTVVRFAVYGNRTQHLQVQCY